MRILITNDDGFGAPGIIALSRAFADLGEVTVVAPDYEKSGISHALTFLQPLFVRELESDHAQIRRYAVNGTPSDCTKLGIMELCGGEPDLVLSGINGGLNAGINCLYSGTLGGAREASFFGIPAFAISIEVEHKERLVPAHMERAGQLTREIVPWMVAENFPGSTMFNLNFSLKSLVGKAEYRVVPMETKRFDYQFVKGTDPIGRPYFWTKHSPTKEKTSHQSDVNMLAEGYATLTPMSYDLTDASLIGRTKELFAGESHSK